MYMVALLPAGYVAQASQGKRPGARSEGGTAPRQNPGHGARSNKKSPSVIEPATDRRQYPVMPPDNGVCAHGQYRPVGHHQRVAPASGQRQQPVDPPAFEVDVDD